MKIESYKTILFLFIVFAAGGCKKYLDAKTDKSFSTPSSVADLQGLLDQPGYMNGYSAETGEIAADNYYLTDSIFQTLPLQDSKDLYLWIQGNLTSDWQGEYNIVYTANVVLDNLPKIPRNSSNSVAYDNCQGSALLYRGKSFFEIAQIWAKAFDSAHGKIDFGIPLRLTSDYNTPSKRSTLEETYGQIISDLKSSIPLLPNKPLNVLRPSKAAAYGLLARVYLMMRNYPLAKLYADSSLAINNVLLDFNKVDTLQPFPFSNIVYSNPEDIMHSSCYVVYLDVYFSYAKVDTILYSKYEKDDLRKIIYFADDGSNGHYFQGSYDAYVNYCGLATDELYLIRSECEARMNNIQSALSDLNTLLVNRYKTGTFVPLTINDPVALLQYILIERRKELYFRMLRWGDIKRLNVEGADISITRIINGQTYTLAPNDNRFALPIPTQVLQLSGIPDNPR